MTVTNTDIEGMEFGPMSEENGSSTSRRNTNGKTCDSEVNQTSKFNPIHDKSMTQCSPENVYS